MALRDAEFSQKEKVRIVRIVFVLVMLVMLLKFFAVTFTSPFIINLDVRQKHSDMTISNRRLHRLNELVLHANQWSHLQA